MRLARSWLYISSCSSVDSCQASVITRASEMAPVPMKVKGRCGADLGEIWGRWRGGGACADEGPVVDVHSQAHDQLAVDAVEDAAWLGLGLGLGLG